jgi:hypothetical protein
MSFFLSIDLLSFVYHFVDKMPNKKSENVQTGTSTLTLLFVAIAGGIIAVSLQPVILLLYSHLGVPTVSMSYQQLPSEVIREQIPTTTVAPVVTTKKPESATTTTTTTTTVRSILVENDPTVDEDPIFLKDEPVTIKIPESTTVKPVVTEKPKAKDTKKVDKSEKKSQSVKFEKVNQEPEIIDVTGRNKQIPDAVKNFKPTKISMFIHILTFHKQEKKASYFYH